MFESLKHWMNVPAQVRPCVGYNGSGTKQFDTPVDILCYPEANVKLVVNNEGDEVVSTTQLYIDGCVQIDVLDNIIFEGTESPIKRVNTFYRNGKLDLKVVYL